MQLYISNLILEVTRRCNMSCAHCLRGPAQNVDMSKETVDRVLDACEHGIGTVTFTGGEPSLNVPIIRYFRQQIKKRKIGLGSFFIVTNGKISSLPLVKELVELYAYCDEREMCGFEMSKDQFHEEVKTPTLYNALKFFNDTNRGKLDLDEVICEGRGEEVGTGMRLAQTDTLDFEITLGEELYVQINNDLQVSANGNVVMACDFSFDRIDEESIGNVHKTPLKKIIGQLARPHIRREKLREAA